MNIVDFHCMRCLDGDSVQAVEEETKGKGSHFLLKKCKDQDLFIASFQFIIFQLLHNSSEETRTLVINLIDKSEAEISQIRPEYISGK